jgi:putative oxidoreductase
MRQGSNALSGPRTVGRLLLALPFLRGSIRALRSVEQLANCARAARVPYPEAATKVTAVAMFGGAAAMATGMAPRSGAVAIIACLGGATGTVHRFWLEEEAAPRAAHREAFITNLALLGALTLVATSTPSRQQTRV